MCVCVCVCVCVCEFHVIVSSATPKTVALVGWLLYVPIAHTPWQFECEVNDSICSAKVHKNGQLE